jgi:hypothetical protein
MAATGKVYIFNTTNQSITLDLNTTGLNQPLGPNTGQAHSYAPTMTSVMRSDSTGTTDAVFAATNSLMVKFEGTNQTYPAIPISPGVYPTNTDLVLYIFYSYALLVSTINNVLVFSGSPTS